MSHRIRRKRPSLRLIVSSATLDAQSFLEYFNSNTAVTGVKPDPSHKPDATIVSLEGRMYPVEVVYLAEPTSDYVQEAVRTIIKTHIQVCVSFVWSKPLLTFNRKKTALAIYLSF